MSLWCEFCGGEIQEFAHTRNQVWMGCHRCQRSWQEDVDPAYSTIRLEPRRQPKPGGLESVLRRYAVAGAAVALAFSARLALKPVIGDASPFLLFTPAVMVAAWYAGPGPGVFATGAGAVFGSQFFLREIGRPGIERWDRLAMFLLVGGLITAFTTVAKASRQRLDESLWHEYKARAQAEAASHSKEDLLSLVSHELQTPVSVVMGWASAIRTRKLHGDELYVALDAIERNAHIQTRLIQDLIDRARIVNGRLSLHPQVVSITEVVRSAVEQMRPVFDHKKVQLTTAIEHTRSSMSADPVRLQQVFTNLLSNAAKFTPSGGHVVVDVSCKAVAKIMIKDNGIGISREFLPRVFDGFQNDLAVSATSPGLGLGLSIARDFVERHGGTIRAASDGPGKGATFTVLLPLGHTPATVEERRPTEASVTHSARVIN